MASDPVLRMLQFAAVTGSVVSLGFFNSVIQVLL